MTGWFKQMIERCMRRKAEGRCATCAMRKVCPHGAKSDQAERAAMAGLSTLFSRLAAWTDPARQPMDSLAARVTGALERRLETGDVSVDTIASDLGMTRSTLYRRLAAEGTTVEQLLERLRISLAERYLQRDRRSVKETAYRLGFSDPAAFSRAYKRWTGLSPSHAIA